MKKKLILIITIAILLIAGILLIFFMKGKKSNTSNESNTDYLAFIEEDKANNCYIYIDKNGNLKKISNEKYKLGKNFEKNSLLVSDNSKKSVVIDSDENILIDESYNVKNQYRNVFTIYKNNKYGLIDMNKNEIIPATYEQISVSLFDNTSLKDLYIASAKNSNNTYDIYFSNKGKIASSIDLYSSPFGGEISYYPVDGINSGIIKYLNSNLDSIYISSKDGTVLAKSEKNGYTKVEVQKNCIAVTENSQKSIQFFDNALNLTKKIDASGSISYAGKFVLMSTKDNNSTKTDVYNEQGEIAYTHNGILSSGETKNDKPYFYDSTKILNSEFKTIVELSNNTKVYTGSRTNHILVKKSSSKYTAYNLDGSIALDDITKINSDNYVKDGKTFFVCNETIVEQRADSEPTASYPAKALNDGSNKYLFVYKDGFQVYDLQNKSITWDYHGDSKQPVPVSGINALLFNNAYYDYNGNKIYEKTSNK